MNRKKGSLGDGDMLRRKEFMDEIMELQVMDTHSHLIGCAQDIWEIADYFGFLESLKPEGIRKMHRSFLIGKE
jgi:hypothetical protein